MIKEEDPRFRHLRKKVATFVALALAVVAVAVLLVGKENDLFTKKYELSLTVDKGTGFTRGMPVKLSGFRIGRVKSISLNEEAKVDIVLQIDRKYRKWIRSDSAAKLVKEGLVGDAIIEVSVGTPAKPVLEDRAQIAYLKTKTLDELADELGESVKPVLKEVKEIIGYVNAPGGDFKQTVKNFNTLSRNLEWTRQRADLLLTESGSAIGTVSGRVTALLEDTSSTMKRADRSLSLIDGRLPELLDHTGRSLEHLEKVSRDLRQAEEEMLPKVPGLVKKAERTLDNGDQVLEAVKGTWPISSRLSLPQERRFVPGDSHD